MEKFKKGLACGALVVRLGYNATSIEFIIVLIPSSFNIIMAG